jgi:hypothetical protein
MSAVLTASRAVFTHLAALPMPTPPAGPGAGTSPDTACPQAPPGLQSIADTFQGYAKWLVIAVLGLGFLVSVAVLVWGRVTHHPRGARLGFDGLMIVLTAAVILVIFWGIVTAIIGTGC